MPPPKSVSKLSSTDDANVGVPYATEPHYDGRGLYYTKRAAYTPLATSLSEENSPWMKEVPQPRGVASPSTYPSHRLNKQFTDYAKQQRQFKANQTSTPETEPTLVLSDPSTTHAEYGSHYRLLDVASAAVAAAAPPSVFSPIPEDLEATSIRVGVGGACAQGSDSSSSAGWSSVAQASYCTPRDYMPDINEQQVKELNITSAHGLGYGHNHPHYHTYLAGRADIQTTSSK